MKDTIEPPQSYREFTKDVKCCLQHFYLWPEWFLGVVAAWLSRRYFVKGLEYIGKLGLLGAIFLWFIPGCHDRKEAEQNAIKTRHYVAWQTINSAVGKPGNAGRTDALQDLNHDRISLRGIDLSGAQFVASDDPQSTESALTLIGTRLNYANLRGARLKYANLSMAKLDHASMDGARCENCDFRGTSFIGASFTNSFFTRCDFNAPDTCTNQERMSNTRLVSSTNVILPFNSKVCTFRFCNFVGVAFTNSVWIAPVFTNCNFAYANLKGVTNADENGSFIKCNLFGVTNASPAFLTWATNHGAVWTNITDYAEWTNWTATH